MRDSSRFALLAPNPSQKQREELVSNILATYSDASYAEQVAGMAWYRNAHSLAEVVGFGDVRKGAGVISALSANTGWSRNRELAELISAGRGSEVKHLTAVLSKVEKILGGADPETVLGGQKTLNFFRNIADPEVSGPVTIDRHAHDIARGAEWGQSNRGLTTQWRYDVLRDAYRDAADQCGIRPHEMQAVTWEVWRNRIAGKSTRGMRHVA